MNIVVLSVCGVEDIYLIKGLRERFSNVKVIKLIPKPKAKNKDRKKFLKPISMSYYWLAEIFYHIHQLWIDNTCARILFGGKPPQIAIDFELHDEQLNRLESEAYIRKLNPDFLVVSGAPILKKNIFSLGREGCINIHYGIVPKYRGGYTNFWPLYYQDWGNIGVTLHFINDQLDGGKLIAQGRPALNRIQTEATVTARSAIIATELLCNFLKRDHAQNRFEGQVQNEKGKVYRYSDRRIWHDLVRWFDKFIRGKRPPTLAEKKTTYYS